MQKKNQKSSAPRKASSPSRKPQSRSKAAATTADVVDRRAVKPPKIDRKWESQYRHLTELRDYFLKQKGGLTRDANDEQPTYSEHMADAGTDSYDRDFALSMLSSDQNALYEIDEALRRIEDGTYGICELTGKPIAKNRLEAIPWARFTVEAEKQLEQNGSGTINRTKLGTLGTLAGRGETEEPETDIEHGEAG